MKLTYHLLLFFALLSTLTISCGKGESDGSLNPPDETKDPDETNDDRGVYIFLRKELIDFKAFKGSEKGGVDVSDTETPESFWNSTKLADYFYDTLRVTKDSIFERPYEYEINDFRYDVRNDSIYRWNRYADFWEFYGMDKADTIEHYVCFYNFQKVTPPSVFAANGHSSGEVKYSRYFNDTEYMFSSPKEMMNKNDEVAWYNIKYIFVRKK